MLILDSDSGSLNASIGYVYRGMNVVELTGSMRVEGPFSDGEDTIYRTTELERWLDYDVEVIAIRFFGGRCTGLTVHLFGLSNDSKNAVEGLLISEHLRTQLVGRCKVKGVAEMQFHPGWGLVTVNFDIKFDSSFVTIRYKRL